MQNMGNKRLVVPIDFKEDVLNKLRSEADAMGLKTATYIKMLLHTHPKREPSASKDKSRK